MIQEKIEKLNEENIEFHYKKKEENKKEVNEKEENENSDQYYNKENFYLFFSIHILF